MDYHEARIERARNVSRLLGKFEQERLLSWIMVVVGEMKRSGHI